VARARGTRASDDQLPSRPYIISRTPKPQFTRVSFFNLKVFLPFFFPWTPEFTFKFSQFHLWSPASAHGWSWAVHSLFCVLGILFFGIRKKKPWNGRGRRLVELTDGCYSGGNSQGLPGWIKQPPCPWDTHRDYQFSIKTLLSKELDSQSLFMKTANFREEGGNRVSPCTNLYVT